MSSSSSSSSSNPFQLPIDMLKLIGMFMDCQSYIAWLGVCTSIRYTMWTLSSYRPNHYIDMVYNLDSIFGPARRNMVLSGMGGSGKSFFLQYVYRWATRLNRNIWMTGMTGMAASLLPDGRTIHSASGLRCGRKSLEQMQEQFDSEKHKCGKTEKAWREVDLIVIDEFENMGARFLSKLNLMAQHSRNNSLPMGGVQVICCGDPFQLPPIADHFCFTSPSWATYKFQTMVFKYSWRQANDRDFDLFLQNLRYGFVEEHHLRKIRERQELSAATDFDALVIKPTRIVRLRKEVKRINDEEYEKIAAAPSWINGAVDTVLEKVPAPGIAAAGAPRVIYQPYTGAAPTATLLTALKEELNHYLPESFAPKESTQYILTHNVDVKKGMVNGSRCAYVAPDSPRLKIVLEATSHGAMEFKGGEQVDIAKFMTCKMVPVTGHTNVYVKRSQIGMRLGYASTDFGCMGSTLTSLLIDINARATTASVYVAFSRAHDWESVFVINFDPKCVSLHKDAVAFQQKLVGDDIQHAIQISKHAEFCAKYKPQKKTKRKEKDRTTSSSSSSSNGKRARVVPADDDLSDSDEDDDVIIVSDDEEDEE